MTRISASKIVQRVAANQYVFMDESTQNEISFTREELVKAGEVIAYFVGSPKENLRAQLSISEIVGVYTDGE